MTELSSLERAVLAGIADQMAAHSSELREQITRMHVSGRENTGHGFYTALEVKEAPYLDALSPLGPIAAYVEGIEHGMGFLLWLEGGKASSLEGYTFDGDLTGKDLETLTFSGLQELPPPDA